LGAQQAVQFRADVAYPDLEESAAQLLVVREARLPEAQPARVAEHEEEEPEVMLLLVVNLGQYLDSRVPGPDGPDVLAGLEVRPTEVEDGNLEPALRTLLGGCPAAPPGVSYVLFEEGYYRLGPDLKIGTNVEEFDEHYERGAASRP
jgi:hypothetical protein